MIDNLPIVDPISTLDIFNTAVVPMVESITYDQAETMIQLMTETKDAIPSIEAIHLQFAIVVAMMLFLKIWRRGDK